MAKKYQYFDITLPLNKDIPLPPAIPLKPGDPPPPENKIPLPSVYRFFDVDKGDKVTMSRIEMSSHDGTHIDSPRHFIPGGPTIDTMAIETTVGPCRVIEIKDEKSVTVKELEPYKIKAGERIIFKTKNSPVVWSKRQWDGKFVTVSLEAAKYLAETKIRLRTRPDSTAAYFAPAPFIQRRAVLSSLPIRRGWPSRSARALPFR